MNMVKKAAGRQPFLMENGEWRNALRAGKGGS
jgi:hypothetical protein